MKTPDFPRNSNGTFKKGNPRPSRRTGVFKKCKKCSSKMYVRQCELEIKKFCSRSCFAKYKTGKVFFDKEKHRKAMKDLVNKDKVKGLRLCSGCKTQKKEKEFSHQKTKYKNTGICKLCKDKRDRAYYRDNREKCLLYFKERVKDKKVYNKVRKINRLSVSKNRCGLDRDKIIKTNTRCEICQITQERHKEKTGVSLNIHHKDNKGRTAQSRREKPNNQLDNLQILCSACHTRLHNRERDYTGRGYKIWESRRKNLNKKLCK